MVDSDVKISTSSSINTSDNGTNCKKCTKIVLKGIFGVNCKFWWHERCVELNFKYISDANTWTC